MKRSEVIKIISEDLEDIRKENYYDQKGSEWCADLILMRLEENGIVNKLLRNKEEVIVPETEMVDFWKGFVENQSKAIRHYSKQNREYRRILRENGILDEKK